MLGESFPYGLFARNEMKIMNRFLCIVVAVLVASSCLALCESTAVAQCSTCASPTVAYYQPTTAYYQPTVTYRTGWYPGRFFDRWRMRRWGVTTAPATTYTAAYAPVSYTASYTPYTAAYAYRPYVTAYAPLARTAYYPVATTVARPVALSPVVGCGSCGCDPCTCSPCGCDTCSYGACDCGLTSCASCSSCSSGVGQAIYSQPSTGCANCAAGAGTPDYSSSNVGPQTPQPRLPANEPTPAGSDYDVQRPADETTEGDPGPATGEGASTRFEAPLLLGPPDRTASRAPTVKVHKAVYQTPAKTYQTNYAPQVEMDENGWYAAE